MLKTKKNGYKCWRVTTHLFQSIESCPVGDDQECLHIAMGHECKAGYELKL